MTTPRKLSSRYELGEILGFGGMSEVHLARDNRLDRDVAIKVLRADLARDPTFYLRFRREAQNAAALNHPAIVAVYDTGEAETEAGPLPFIVMEYVEGSTLRDIVRAEGPMAPRRAMEVIADVCAALDFSHRNGIVHRDVKPANVMINNAGLLTAGAFEEIPLATHHRDIDVNVKGVVNGLHVAFPFLRRTPGSTVINLASASAIYGQAELANYSATKFYVRAFTEALNIEWAGHDIRVIDMWPLYVNTAMTKGVSTGTTQSLGIRLTAQDIADDIVAAVDAPWTRRTLRQVHFPVGAQAKTLALASRFSPGWLTRLVNKQLAHK